MQQKDEIEVVARRQMLRPQYNVLGFRRLAIAPGVLVHNQSDQRMENVNEFKSRIGERCLGIKRDVQSSVYCAKECGEFRRPARRTDQGSELRIGVNSPKIV